MSSTSKRSKPAAGAKLKVVFDTNVLYTGSASDLVAKAVAEMIGRHSGHRDLTIAWHVPEVVLHERKYQMIRRGMELLPSIRKMERLLGHNLNITEETVRQRVDDAVERQRKALGLEPIVLAIDSVDWQRLMLDASFRRPPFEPGNTEKGFRDALVGEAFLQLVEASPVTPKACRVALVTADQLLSAMVDSRTSERSNVRLLQSIEAVEELINTLVSEITEEYVATLHPAAKALFFTSDDKESLYFTGGVYERISKAFATELAKLPKGAVMRQFTQTLVGPPRFVRKSGQKAYWASRVTLQVDAFRRALTTMFNPQSEFLDTMVGLLSSQRPGMLRGGLESAPLFRKADYNEPLGSPVQSSDVLVPSSGRAGLQLSPRPPVETPAPQMMKIATGQHVFEVVWSATVTTRQKLLHPAVEDVTHVESKWT